MLKKICLKLIKIYQFFSRLTPANCRFQPTCSSYTYQAIERFGALKGIYLGIKRISKCHPFHEGGYDPVPENFKW
ncbi:MAG: membrane protein insertion efficiency factor YidD [Candidatus Gastranaerophilales bacterium]|nr:membrane protein insertion efficiency factor YidD [Candidatus Gastranaerophilales bacterium]